MNKASYIRYEGMTGFSDGSAVESQPISATVRRQLGKRLQAAFRDSEESPVPEKFTALLEILSQRMGGEAGE